MQQTSLVRKTVAVLRAVAAASGNGAGLSDLARVTGLPKATTLRVLNDLVAENLVALDPETKRYGIAFGMLSIAGSLLDHGGLVTALHRRLQSLVDATGETAGLDVLVDRDVVVIAQVQSPFAINYAPREVPRTLPVWSTSTGKVLLAALDREVLDTVHADSLAKAAAARGEQESFPAELDAIRAAGFGTAHDEMEAGASAVAAPVISGDRVVAAVWIGGPSFRLTPDRMPELATAVIAAATDIADLLELDPGALLGLAGRTGGRR